MSEIHMLALDVDGTLAAQGNEVTPATRAALHRAVAAGVEVVIATGRRYRSTARVVEQLGLEVATVCLGGALTKEADRRTIHHTPIDQHEVAHVLGQLRESGLTFVAQRDSHGRGGADVVVDNSIPWNTPIRRYIEGNADHIESRSDLVEQPPEQVLVVGTFGDHEPLAKVRAQLDALHPGRFTSTLVPTPRHDFFYLEILGAHVSKWSALERLASRRQIASEAVCAVGDQLNDLSMIRGSGLGVAMQNGHDDLKTAADWVCGRNDEDGLVAVVDHILGER